MARHALRLFRVRGQGRLVIVGSVLGKITTAYLSSYVTGKWGVYGLVRTLQIETRADPDIYVSLVSPGSVDAPAYTQAATYVGRHGAPPPPVLPPAAVANVVLRVLEHPRRDRSVGAANWLLITGFRVMPVVFEYS